MVESIGVDLCNREECENWIILMDFLIYSRPRLDQPLICCFNNLLRYEGMRMKLSESLTLDLRSSFNEILAIFALKDIILFSLVPRPSQDIGMF
jgi:hypothetical protein